MVAASGRPFDSLAVPLTAVPSSSPVMRNESEPLRLPWRRVNERRRDAGDAALHVDRAAAIEDAVRDLAGKRRMRPARCVARRHHIGMACKDEMRRAGADRREQVLDVRRAGRGKRSRSTLKPAPLSADSR